MTATMMFFVVSWRTSDKFFVVSWRTSDKQSDREGETYTNPTPHVERKDGDPDILSGFTMAIRHRQNNRQIGMRKTKLMLHTMFEKYDCELDILHSF